MCIDKGLLPGCFHFNPSGILLRLIFRINFFHILINQIIYHPRIAAGGAGGAGFAEPILVWACHQKHTSGALSRRGAGFAEPFLGEPTTQATSCFASDGNFFALSADRKRSPQCKKMPLFFRKVAWVVELEGFEPSSKQRTEKLSTCLASD